MSDTVSTRFDEIDINAIDIENVDLSNYTNKELFFIYKHTKSLRIRNDLIKRHLYIAEILSKKYMNKGIEYEDIHQVASLATIELYVATIIVSYVTIRYTLFFFPLNAIVYFSKKERILVPAHNS